LRRSVSRLILFKSHVKHVSHILRSVNSVFCALHGKRPDEMIGLPIALAISGAAAERVLLLLDRVYAGDHNSGSQASYSDPFHFPGHSHKYKSYMAWTLPMQNGLLQGLVIQVTDLNEQALAMEQLQLATSEIHLLNDDIRQVNEKLIVSALHQQTLADRNREIAEALQYSILWAQPEKSFDSLRVAAFYEAAGDDALVGGDFFDAFRLHNQSVMLVVGDVTGKGLRAAARTVEVRFALRAFAQDYKDPGDTMARLNEFICDFHFEDDEVGSALIVLSLVVIDPITGAVQAASGGADPPLILRVSGAVEEASVQGLILGINHDAPYTSASLNLEEGDTLIMTTDGITETRRGMDFFGVQRLLDTAQKADGGRRLSDMGKSVLDAARAHGGGRFTDDVCLLLVRRDHIASADAA
jgi:serine phosphatase RsbU (regulator of sigma subunit)